MNKKFIRLKQSKEKSILNFHPWIFSGAVKNYSDDLEIGEEVLVLSSDNSPLALAHYCGNNSLFARIFSFNPQEKIDDNFWLKKFEKALLLRKSLNIFNEKTTGFRLIHGEADGFSGLVCDIYHNSAVVNLTNDGLKNILPLLEQFLKEKLTIQNFFSNTEAKNHQELFLENGLKFFAHIGQGQKTGHFLDQRNNRKLVSEYSKDKRVLDAFCYSGGFSTYAFFGGAKKVTSVDISPLAIAQCSEHVKINGFDTSRHSPVQKDCFDFLNNIKEDEFDIIILDPPAFSKSQASVTKAAKGYKEINLKAMKSLKSGSMLFTFSCSQSISNELFQQIIFAAAKDAKKDIKIIHRLSQGQDHPVSIFCPQSDYLKGLVLFVE